MNNEEVSVRQKRYEWLMRSLTMIISIAIYLLSIFIFPFIGQQQNIDLTNSIPPSDAEAIVWILYILMIVAPAMIGVCIFELLLFDGINTGKQSDKYKEAMNLLSKQIKEKHKYIPISPKQWMLKTQTSKMIFTFLGSLASVFVITNVVLNWNVQTFVAILVTLSFSLMMSFLTRKEAIQYYSQDILDYAKYITNKEDDANGISITERQDS